MLGEGTSEYKERGRVGRREQLIQGRRNDWGGRNSTYKGERTYWEEG